MISSRRFWKHCMLLDDSPDTCWIWTGAVTDVGYGRYFTGKGEIPAHRAAWELRYGEPPPKNLNLKKDCAHPQCVRHWISGKPRQKLSDADVKIIRQRTLSLHQLARKFNTDFTYVAQIRMGLKRKRTRVRGLD